ncbi:MAG: ATP-binding protein [Chloroflexi bacterium]|nr:ATP-binding protein [Chloroflexota bacterium]
MGKEAKTQLYITAVLLAAAATAVGAAALWPIQWTAANILASLMVAALVVLASRYPFKLSPQAEASLFTVPLFMGVLLLHPVHAIIAAACAVAVTERMQHRPLRVTLFNIGVTVFMVGISGLAFRGLLPSGAALSLALPITMSVAALAGATLHFTNLALIAGMVTIRKGVSFWQYWKETWKIDIAQEGGALILGAAGALLAAQALWAALLLIVPVAFAYFAFRRSVEETRRNVELAEANGKLAAELEGRVHQLQETQTQLIMQSEKLASVGVTAASVVHEVKNAMAVTSGRAELLMRHSQLYLKSEGAFKHVSGIHEMTQRVTSIVQELLAYSRNDANRAAVSLSEAMDVAADLVGRRAAASGVSIERRYQETPPVNGVPTQLQQVFVNLLINAVDAMPSGGKITLKAAERDGFVEASVRDTGCGIPEEVMARMFQPFFTTKESGKGTGLGMFVCNKIVTDHEGEIVIDSVPNQYTEITVRLPVAASEGSERPAAKVEFDIDREIEMAVRRAAETPASAPA